jgi:hypothetical protein
MATEGVEGMTKKKDKGKKVCECKRFAPPISLPTTRGTRP